jgi:hypothetical protein
VEAELRLLVVVDLDRAEDRHLVIVDYNHCRIFWEVLCRSWVDKFVFIGEVSYPGKVGTGMKEKGVI